MDKNRYFQIRSGKYIKTKVADIQRLHSKWLWLVTVVYKPSFADAEPTKDGLQNHIRCYFAHNIAQVEDTFTQVLGDEVAG